MKNYRESYNLHTNTSICFNHCSPKRGVNFVTRKITLWLGSFLEWAEKILKEIRFVHKDEIDPVTGKLKPESLSIFKGDGKDGLRFSEKHIHITSNPYSSSIVPFPKLHLGNIRAYRDFGFSGDYVKAMHLMLQQDNPDDYVISTGETHSVAEFLEEAFSLVGIQNFTDYIFIDSAFFRPAEVDYLCGYSEKIRTKLGWVPSVTFKDLVYLMVKSDARKYVKENK